MNTMERLFDPSGAFDHPVTVGVTVGAAAAVTLSLVLVEVLGRRGSFSPPLLRDLRDRCRTWAFLAPAMLAPILLGAAWVFAAVLVLALASYREYARATGLFRERATSLLVVVGILVGTFAILDHWYDFFVALWPLTTCAIAAAGLLGDRPQGYLQRVALGLFGFLLFGMCLGHLAYFGNDAAFRPILAWLGMAVAMNDVFPFVVGKAIGRHRLAPKTSPNKTVEGAVGALVLTTALAAWVGHFVFEGTALDQPRHLLTLGLLISVGGQLGDLMLSSIKRDVGIKDTGNALPGHGGILDRFTSFLVVAPAVFHYVGYVLGVGLDEPARILTGP